MRKNTTTINNKNSKKTAIFISPDESLEERRKTMIKRFKFRAERDGKDVSVENGI